MLNLLKASIVATHLTLQRELSVSTPMAPEDSELVQPKELIDPWERLVEMYLNEADPDEVEYAQWVMHSNEPEAKRIRDEAMLHGNKIKQRLDPAPEDAWWKTKRDVVESEPVSAEHIKWLEGLEVDPLAFTGGDRE